MAMKESGIEWVGLIPDTWNVIPNKYVMHKEKNLCEKWTGEEVMSLTMNGVIVRDLQNPTGKMPATFDGYQYIEDGDLLMCLFDIDVTPRCVGKVTNDGVTSPAYSNFKIHDNASRDYFYYYYLMVDNTKELLHLAKNLRHSFTEEQLGQLKVPMPPLSEQKVIADYLVETCSQIDEIIVEAKESIDEYKELKQSVIFEAVTKGLDKNDEMKDSGVKWIGKINRNIVIKKIKYTSNISRGLFNYRPRNAEFLYGGTHPFIQTGDVARANKYVTDYKQALSDEGTKISKFFPKGTLTMTIAANVGDVSILGFDAYFPDSVLGITPFDKYSSEYLYYVFSSMKSEFVRVSISNAQLNLNVERVKELFVPIFEDSDVQKEMVDYLDEKCRTIDSLITEKDSLINDLEAYKKSLIYEVVTGKRRVV